MTGAHVADGDLEKTQPNYPRLIAGSAGIALFGQVVGNSSRLLFHILLANLLGAASYGLFSIGLSFLNVLSILALMGLNMGVVRYLPIYETRKDWARLKGTAAFSLLAVFSFSCLLALSMQYTAGPLAIYLFKKPGLIMALKLFGWILPFYSLMILLSFIFRGLKKLHLTVFVREIIQPLVALAGLLLLFLSRSVSLVSSLVGYGISVLCAFLIGVLFLWRQWGKYAPVKPILQGTMLLRFSLPLLLVHFLVLLLSRVDVMMLGYFRTSAETGIYAAAFRISQLMFIFWTAVNAIFAPLFAGLHSQGDMSELRRLFKMTSRWVFSLTLPFVCFLFVFNGPVLDFFGEGFRDGGPALCVLLVMWLILSFSGSLGSILVMSGHQIIELLLAFGALVVNIGLNILLIRPLGMMGAALATASSLVLFNLVKMFMVYKLTNLHPFEKTYVRILIPFAPLIGLLILYRALAWGNFLPGLLIMAFVSIGIYLFVLFYKGLTPGDKRVFLSLVPGTGTHARNLQRGKL